MEKLIVILLIIIILILCPALLIVGIISIGTFVSMLLKIVMFLMPLFILTILIIVLVIVNRISNKKSVSVNRSIIYINILLSLIISTIFYLNNAFFVSYSFIFCTIIFYILHSIYFKDIITLKILIGILAFLWSIAFGLESHILFGDFLELNRELPSLFTVIFLSVPFILPLILSPFLAIIADWKKVKFFWKQHYRMIFITFGICICGFSCGFLLVIIPDIIQKIF